MLLGIRDVNPPWPIQFAKIAPLQRSTPFSRLIKYV
jgi:hypothetical protein